MTRLNGQRFRSDEVRLALSLLAYNLRNLWQRLFGKTAQPDGAFAAAGPIGAAVTRNRSGRRRGMRARCPRRWPAMGQTMAYGFR